MVLALAPVVRSRVVTSTTGARLTSTSRARVRPYLQGRIGEQIGVGVLAAGAVERNVDDIAFDLEMTGIDSAGVGRFRRSVRTQITQFGGGSLTGDEAACQKRDHGARAGQIPIAHPSVGHTPSLSRDVATARDLRVDLAAPADHSGGALRRSR